MKRKRGHKKGKQKKASVVPGNVPAAELNKVSLNMEDNSGFDDVDSSQLDSGMEVEVLPSTGLDSVTKLTNSESDGLSAKPVERSGHKRVKVKLVSSKMLESHRTTSETPSDTDRSSLQVGLERQGEKMEDSDNSLPEMQGSVSGKSSKKVGSIKFKSSRGLGSSSAIINHMSSPIQVQGERTPQTASDNGMTVDSSTSRESRHRELPNQDSQYNELELHAALGVIKKVMKMDAAEPFNVPVNPVALGIPDYFDIIDTPMDFGTICSNLEHGNKYMNSEDVLKDVDYIWENCYRYNNKGDYILDLMKRVKKNFTKYWMAAGLYSDQLKRNNAGNEIIQVENFAPLHQEKIHVKGSYLKHKTRRRHGINHHKSDCLCAVCVVRRRRKEREGNAQVVENQIGVRDGKLCQEFKQEGTSPLDTPCSEEASSNLENSPDPDADADLEGEEMKFEPSKRQYRPQQQQEMSASVIEIQKNGGGEPFEQLQLGDDSEEKPNLQSVAHVTEESGFAIGAIHRDDRLVQPEEEAVDVQQCDQGLQQKQEEPQERHRQIKKHNNFLSDENPLILNLCGTLFPNDPKSVWSGLHSLGRRQPVHSSNPFHAALTMFMK